MTELVVISGKGGTGKTSIVASLASLAAAAAPVTVADCDVDAADLHLLLDGETIRAEDFSGGVQARVWHDQCTRCGQCERLCRFDAVRRDGPRNLRMDWTFRIDPVACEGCGVCAWFCPVGAIECRPAINGQWFLCRTALGPMVRAKLHAAEENSGKLVSLVRAEARKAAEADGCELILVDGAPGIGCPVIASIGGADMVLVVTEPTLSGRHDLGRVLDLTKHFGVEAMVCVNKWDLNGEIADRIAADAEQRGAVVAGRVRYDRAVTDAMIERRAVVDCGDTGVGEDVRNLWTAVSGALAAGKSRQGKAQQ